MKTLDILQTLDILHGAIEARQEWERDQAVARLEIRGPSAEKLAERRPGQFNEELPCIWFDYAGDEKDPKRELDERAWKGVLSWRFFIEQGWFLSVLRRRGNNCRAQFRIPKENAAAYGPYRYNPARLSHFALRTMISKRSGRRVSKRVC